MEDAIVRRRYERSLKNFFSLYQPLADDWRVYDNSSDTGSRIVADGHGATATAIHDQQTWDEMQRRVGS